MIWFLLGPFVAGIIATLLWNWTEQPKELVIHMTAFSFSEFRSYNLGRARLWHPGFPNDDEWSGADWGNAMAGECGEACNVIKKLRRVETGLVGVNTATVQDLANELADLVTYADLVAAKYGIDLGQAVIKKFNEVSDREGIEVKIPDDNGDDNVGGDSGCYARVHLPG